MSSALINFYHPFNILFLKNSIFILYTEGTKQYLPAILY